MGLARDYVDHCKILIKIIEKKDIKYRKKLEKYTAKVKKLQDILKNCNIDKNTLQNDIDELSYCSIFRDWMKDTRIKMDKKYIKK